MAATSSSLFILGQHHRLHHGADDAVGQDEDGVAVPVGIVKGGVGHVHRLLDGGGGKDQHLEPAVAAGLGGLEIVHLGGLDGAHAGPPREMLAYTMGMRAEAQ